MTLASNEQELLSRVPGGLFIGGQWTDAEEGRTFDVRDPATNEVIASIADATPADGIRALDAAVAAQDDWAATAPRTRSDILRRAFDLVQQHKEDLALLMTLEMGKPLAEARGEVVYGGEFLRWFSEEAVRISGRYGSNPEGTGQMIVSQRPVGPSFFVTPWNFPFAMATRKIAPALAAGCTVVIKPPALTPLTTIFFTKLLEEAGLPAGVVNVVQTSRSGALSGPIIADPRLRKLSFTGSTEVGRKLIAQAADGILRVSMELGGNAPFVVFEDADLDKAVDGAMAAKFRNIGQACTAANRFIVHQDVADEFARRVAERVQAMKVGRGTEDGVAIGPLIDEDAVPRHRSWSGTPSIAARACSPAARPSRGPARSTSPPCSPMSSPAAPSCARRSSGRCSPSRPSPTRLRPCGSRTTPSTGWSRTCSPRTSAAATG